MHYGQLNNMHRVGDREREGAVLENNYPKYPFHTTPISNNRIQNYNTTETTSTLPDTGHQNEETLTPKNI